MTVKYYDWVEYQSNFRPEKVAIKEISSSKELTYRTVSYTHLTLPTIYSV